MHGYSQKEETYESHKVVICPNHRELIYIWILGNHASTLDSSENTRKPSGTTVTAGLDPLKAPFRHPFQYIGMSIANAAKATGVTPNAVGNIIIDSDRAHMLLEAEGNFISYADVELKQTAPCRLTRAFDSEPVLGALGINPSELDLSVTKVRG